MAGERGHLFEITPHQSRATCMRSQGCDTWLPAEPSPTPLLLLPRQMCRRGWNLWGREPPASADRTKADWAGSAAAGSGLVDRLPWKHAGEEGWQPPEQSASILTQLPRWGFPPQFQPAHSVCVSGGVRWSLLLLSSVPETVLAGGSSQPSSFIWVFSLSQFQSPLWKL